MPTVDRRALVPDEQVGGTSLVASMAVASPGLRDYTIATRGGAVQIVDALSATLLDERTAMVAVPASDDPVVANLFMIDLERGAAEALLAVPLAPMSGGVVAAVLPLGAAGGRVAWTAGYCGHAPHVQMLDLGSREVLETDLSGWVDVLEDGRLALGNGFRTMAIADPTDAEWDAVLPPDLSGDVVWSSDFHFALTGFTGGHGLGCPGV